MIFKNIAALVAANITLTIQVASAEAGKLEVSVIPASTGKASGRALVAKSFVATPEELDAEFADVIKSFSAVNLSLSEQLTAVQAEADQLVADAKAEANAKEASKVALKAPGKLANRKGGATPSLSDPDEGDEDEDGSDADGGHNTLASDTTLAKELASATAATSANQQKSPAANATVPMAFTL
jgi:PRTRC genetic system protein E